MISHVTQPLLFDVNSTSSSRSSFIECYLVVLSWSSTVHMKAHSLGNWRVQFSGTFFWGCNLNNHPPHLSSFVTTNYSALMHSLAFTADLVHVHFHSFEQSWKVTSPCCVRSCLYVTDHGEKCLSFKHHCLTSQLSKTFSSRPHIWTTSIFLHVLCSKVLTSLASIIICSPSTLSGYIHHRCTSVSYCVTSSIIVCSPSTLSGYIHHRLSLFPPRPEKDMKSPLP